MKLFFATLLLSVLPFVPRIDNDDVPINRIQVIGSHNSYKKAIDPALFRLFQIKDSVSASKIDYEHIPLTDQLNMGLLNLEIDIYVDEKGGKYAKPKGLTWAKNQPPFDPDGEMLKPGFKVFHIPDLDFRSQCLTLIDALRELRAWSVAHPDHNPIFITIEPKDAPIKNTDLTSPEPFTGAIFDELDKNFIDNLGKDQIITPDMVRGKYPTLEDAVLHDNWPTLKQAKGKFLFLLDNHEKARSLYMAGHTSLKGRVLFTDAEPGTPEAAMMLRNNPKNPEISKLVKKGYIIRTRSDSDTQQARKNDKSDFIVAQNSGAQIITTDYYLKSTHFKSDYVISFEDGGYFRLNPLFANSKGEVKGSK